LTHPSGGGSEGGDVHLRVVVVAVVVVVEVVMLT